MRVRGDRPLSARQLTTACVFTAATNFHHVGIFSVLAVLATVLAALFGGTVAWAVRALARSFFSHLRPPCSSRSDSINIKGVFLY